MKLCIAAACGLILLSSAALAGAARRAPGCRRMATPRSAQRLRRQIVRHRGLAQRTDRPRHRQAEDRQAQSRSGQARASAHRPAVASLAAERPGQMVGPDLQRRRRPHLSSELPGAEREHRQGARLRLRCCARATPGRARIDRTRAIPRDSLTARASPIRSVRRESSAQAARRETNSARPRPLAEQHRLHFRILHVDALAQLEAERHAALAPRGAPSWSRASV